MQQWISYHFYPIETADVFLARAWRPFLEQYIWPEKGSRAFFIRYDDESGPHLRLRLRAETHRLEEVIKPAFEGWMLDRGEYKTVAYLPETDRFGGPDKIDLAEEYFHLSTRVVLDRLNKPYTYGDALFDTLRMHTISVHAAGMDHAKAAWYFSKLTDQWLPLFFHAEPGTSVENLTVAVKKDFEQAYFNQRDELRETIHSLWDALESDKFDVNQPEWRRWLHGNRLILDAYGPSLEQVLPSLLHLSANRLGVNNQDEVYLNYILSQTLT